MTKSPYDPFAAKYHFSAEIPEGDDRERAVCGKCGWIHYVNPRMIVGAVCTWEDKILLCKRAIEPRKGFWTLPAGFLEQNETTMEGVAREAQEEACADITVRELLAVYNVPHISQVQIMYLADLNDPDVRPGPESEDVALVTWEDIPWDDIAFPSVFWALNQYRSLEGRREFTVFGNPEGEMGTRFRAPNGETKPK